MQGFKDWLCQTNWQVAGKLMDETTAYHEAGHAFAAVRLGARVRLVTIAPDAEGGPQRYGDPQHAVAVGTRRRAFAFAATGVRRTMTGQVELNWIKRWYLRLGPC